MPVNASTKPFAAFLTTGRSGRIDPDTSISSATRRPQEAGRAGLSRSSAHTAPRAVRFVFPVVTAGKVYVRLLATAPVNTPLYGVDW